MPDRYHRAMSDREHRYAVVVNPIKVGDDFEREVTDTFFANGWGRPLWLETTKEDAGRAMTKQARDAGVETVIVAGGDGTVRLVADGLAGSPVKMGIIPSGTGNLLARNLNLPLDREGALHVILAKQTSPIDLIEITVDAQPPEHFAVMAGAGVDSAIMSDADPRLKAKLGPAAYFFSVGKALGRLPMDARITVDGHRPHHRRAMVVLVGNVGQLVGGIDLMPRAGRLRRLAARLRRLAAPGPRLAPRRRTPDHPARLQGRLDRQFQRLAGDRRDRRGG